MTRRADPPAEFEGVVVKRATAMALLCDIEGAEHWIPRSQLLDGLGNELADEGDEGRLVCTQWIAEQKGIV